MMQEIAALKGIVTFGSGLSKENQLMLIVEIETLRGRVSDLENEVDCLKPDVSEDRHDR